MASWTRSRTQSAGRAERARIVLAVADGAGTTTAARQVGVSRPTVIKWRDRFAAHGLAGLETFQFSTDPEPEAKVRDVVGLYLNPPEKATHDYETRVASSTSCSIGQSSGRHTLADRWV